MEIPFERHNYIKDHTEYQSDHLKSPFIFEPNSVTQIEQAVYLQLDSRFFLIIRTFQIMGGQRVLTTTYQFCILKSVG